MNIHVSFDIVDEFVPRVPDSRNSHEDNTIPRICVSDSVLQALWAIPLSGNIMEGMRELGLPVVVHAYYLSGKTFCPTIEQVPDREMTGERWLLERPEKVFRRDYKIESFWTREIRDNETNISWRIPGGFHLKPCKYQDNWTNLAKRFSIDNDNLASCQNICSFRGLMQLIGYDPKIRKKLGLDT